MLVSVIDTFILKARLEGYVAADAPASGHKNVVSEKHEDIGVRLPQKQKEDTDATAGERIEVGGGVIVQIFGHRRDVQNAAHPEALLWEAQRIKKRRPFGKFRDLAPWGRRHRSTPRCLLGIR